MIYCKVLIPMDSIALDVLGKGDKPFLCKCTRSSGFPFVLALHNYRKPVYFSIIGLYSYSRTKRVFFQEAFKFIVLVSVGLWYRLLNCVEKHIDLRKPNWHKLNHLKWNQWGCKHESICNQKLRLFSTSYSIEFLVHRIRIAEEDRKT